MQKYISGSEFQLELYNNQILEYRIRIFSIDKLNCCRASKCFLPISRFGLCLCSPVFYKMICGDFREKWTGILEIEDVEITKFIHLMDLWCGKMKLDHLPCYDLMELIDLAALADRFQMQHVMEALEKEIVKQMSTDTCAQVLANSGSLGLLHVELAARNMLVERFEQVAATDDYMMIDEETLSLILDDDWLDVANEETALKAAVRWMEGQGGPGLRGVRVLRTIRFGLIDDAWLARWASRLPAAVAASLEPFLREAALAQAARLSGRRFSPRHLGASALVPRLGRSRASAGGRVGRYLYGVSGEVTSLVERRRRICGASPGAAGDGGHGADAWRAYFRLTPEEEQIGEAMCRQCQIS